MKAHVIGVLFTTSLGLSSCGFLTGANVYTCIPDNQIQITNCNDIGTGLGGPIIECTFKNNWGGTVDLGDFIKTWSFDSDNVQLGNGGGSLTASVPSGGKVKDRTVYMTGAKKVILCSANPSSVPSESIRKVK